MATAIRVLILGASYGSLLGAKMALAGHTVKLVCLPEEVELINSEGAHVRMAARGVDGLVELNSQNMRGDLSAAGPTDVDPADYDLIALAMQEPQYGVPAVSELLGRVAASGKPCMSIMNMPPLTYLQRFSGLDSDALRSSYTEPSVWDAFDPALMTLCSPDPQAFRPPEEKINVLQVGLPTNFKAARFDSDEHTAILQQLEADIQAIRFDVDGTPRELPVKLRVHDSIFTPLAKWSMLMAGNYRCVQEDAMRPIKEAVHTDLAATQSVYEWVIDLCEAMGGERSDLVPFEKYANAALSLVNPSSAARALANGAPNIERVDKLVQSVAAQFGMQSDSVDETVVLVDGWLEKNRGR
ncbi:MAG TPA: hypothetical protein EYQ61_08055 [Dehalococcoidia bacterium]|nr:hypothetical protein [Dehalococcoidia bacterium]